MMAGISVMTKPFGPLCRVPGSRNHKIIRIILTFTTVNKAAHQSYLHFSLDSIRVVIDSF